MSEPAQAAKNEAARQAVILVFTMAGALVLMAAQRRMLRGLLPGGPAPAQEAAARERRWGKAAVMLWRRDLLRAARWAESRAQAARRDYEAQLP